MFINDRFWALLHPIRFLPIKKSLSSNPLWLAIIICNSESGFCSNAKLYQNEIQWISQLCNSSSSSVLVRTSRDQVYFSLDPFWLLWGGGKWNTPVGGISVVSHNVSIRKLNSGIMTKRCGIARTPAYVPIWDSEIWSSEKFQMDFSFSFGNHHFWLQNR